MPGVEEQTGKRPGVIRLVVVALVVCLFGALMSTLLTRAKLQDGLSQIVEARVLAAGRELARSVERAQGLGLNLAELDTLPALLERHRAVDPLIGTIDVFDEAGQVIASSEPARAGAAVPDAVRRVAERAGETPWSAELDGERVAGVTLRTGFGLVIGHVGLRYAEDELTRAMDAADGRLLPAAALYFGLAAVISFVAVTWLARRERHALAGASQWPFALACLLPLLCAMAAFGLVAREAFSEQLTPQALRKATTLGAGVAELVGEARQAGFAFESLYGVEAALSELRARNPEVAFAAARDAGGQMLFSDGQAPDDAADTAIVPLVDGSESYGRLVFAIDPAFVSDMIGEMAIDVAVVLVVALVLAGELVRHVTGTAGGAPAAPLMRIRAPVFTFILAEELTRPCLPSYIGRLASDGAGAVAPLVVSLPIALFMLIVALGQPVLGRWSERIGRRRALLTGALVGAVGFVGSGFSQGLYDLIAWRAVCALGYAVVFSAGQGYVLEQAGEAGRTRGFAVFVGAIMAATVCGPSIGGILADQLGQRATFLVSALLCIAALVPMWGLAGRGGAAPQVASQREGFGGLVRLLANRRFAALTCFAAIPAKVLLIGVLFYLVPLYVVDLGHGQAMAGRLIMLYGLLMVLLVPVAARHGEGFARRVALVGGGLAASGAGGFAVAAMPDLAGLFALAALLGLGQALSISAQAALVGELCRDEIASHGVDAVYGAYRMLERLGNVAGPLVAGVLVASTGYAGAFAILGGGALACALLLRLGLSEPAVLPAVAGEAGR
ncbi:MAG: MFS transporter [Rhodocyclaceae bacterium]|nr:MFS transporter [Rhodocyclaceae bacterium]